MSCLASKNLLISLSIEQKQLSTEAREIVGKSRGFCSVWATCSFGRFTKSLADGKATVRISLKEAKLCIEGGGVLHSKVLVDEAIGAEVFEVSYKNNREKGYSEKRVSSSEISTEASALIKLNTGKEQIENSRSGVEKCISHQTRIATQFVSKGITYWTFAAKDMDGLNDTYFGVVAYVDKVCREIRCYFELDASHWNIEFPDHKGTKLDLLKRLFSPRKRKAFIDLVNQLGEIEQEFSEKSSKMCSQQVELT